jgi:predicted membrane channel-forming protein YqfA (hemolysin III family)
MRDATIRASRTFFQSLIGAFLATTILNTMVSTSTLDVDALQRAGISAFAAALISLLSFIQNALEDASGKTALK